MSFRRELSRCLRTAQHSLSLPRQAALRLAQSAVAALPSRQFSRKGRGTITLIVFVALLSGACAISYMLYREHDTSRQHVASVAAPEGNLPRQASYGGYTTSNSCRECHPNEYSSWHASYHRTMTQVATPESVLGDFDDVHLRANGREYLLERRGDEFWVTLPDPELEDGHASASQVPPVTREVVMTTGSHNMQGYWVAGTTGNQLWQLPWWFKISEGIWIPRKAGFLEPEATAPSSVMWNERCIFCHTVAGAPGISLSDHTIDSTVAELGIACEACHGYGERHIEKHRRGAVGREQLAAHTDRTIFNPAHAPKESSQVCGQCHSYYLDRSPEDTIVNGMGFLPGDSLDETRHVLSFSGPSAHSGSNRNPAEEEYLAQGYWKDGACRVGGDEYLGLIESSCYMNGELSCLSCHSMHASDPADQLSRQLQRNESCLQCHVEFAGRVEEHTHHPEQSAGSLCYNCHMPYTSYALLTALRSHRIDSPSVSASIATGRPNACNMCHANETLGWTADNLTEWYGNERNDDSLKSASDIPAMASLLIKGNALQRAIAAWTFGWQESHAASGTHWQAPLLIESLDDPYPAVRFIAHQSLKSFSGFEDFKYDFVANQEQRISAMADARAVWEQSDRGEAFDGPLSALFDSNGSINRELYEQLKKQRDESLIQIPE